MDCLQPPVLQSASTLLAELKDAQLNRRSTIQAMGESIHVHVSSDEHGVCLAAPSHQWNNVCSTENSPCLPVSLLETFKTCSVSMLERKFILEAFFLSRQFESATYLAESLDKFCSAIEELLHTNVGSFLAELSPSDCYQTSSHSYLSLHRLKSIVALARSFMQEFESVTMTGEEGSPQQGPLHMTSMVYSEVSHSTLNSLKYRSPFLPELSDHAEQKTYQKQSLEEFSLILSLKDAVLSSFASTSSEYSIIVKLISDIFPNCDIQGLLAHEENVREGLAVKSKEDKGAAESSRESRAASAMQMVQDEHQPSEGITFSLYIISHITTLHSSTLVLNKSFFCLCFCFHTAQPFTVETSLEHQIVLSCQSKQLVPTQLFQTAVSQVSVCLYQLHNAAV